MNKPEFKVGDEVTFHPYEKGYKMKVAKIGPNPMPSGEPDDRVFYHLSVDGKLPVTSVSTGKWIEESALYKPQDGET